MKARLVTFKADGTVISHTDWECDLMREEREGLIHPPLHPPLSDQVRLTTIPYREPAQRKKPLPPLDPRNRWGLMGWYNDECELAAELDKVYGQGKWRLVGHYIEYQLPSGIWGSYYAFKQFRSGRFYVYDETMD